MTRIYPVNSKDSHPGPLFLCKGLGQTFAAEAADPDAPHAAETDRVRPR
jgi:hypothetical protein